jgi:putative ABC transport system permease protein
MKFLPLVWKNLFRRKIRTLFTVLSILVAFILFAYLAAVRVAFSLGVEVAGADRMITMHKVSFIQPLPEAYQGRIEAVEGVIDVTHASWFGGIYQDPQNFFAQFAVVPEDWLAMYPEYLLEDAEREAWLGNRTGAIVGRDLADRFGWEVGDRLPLQGTIYRTQNDGPWEFTIDGIYEADQAGVDTSQFFFNYEYLAETNTQGRGAVGYYVIRIDNPARSVDVAATVDERFANSQAETKTSTEQAFAQEFANQVGNVGAMITAIVIAVLFTILLVTANTMAQSIRERTSELAVLKTLGFSNLGVLVLVLAESMLIAVVGGALGLAIGYVLISQGDPTGGFLPAFFVPPRDLVIGSGLALLLGVVSGLMPAVQATRLRIVDALRKV